MRLVAAALVCALGLASSPPVMAQPRQGEVPADPPMQIQLVRSTEPGCEPQCPEWIAAQGKIEAGAAAQFKRVLRQLGDRKAPLLIDSNGGRVSEALDIGRMARARGFDIAVSRTVFATCSRADAACRRAKADKVRLGLPQPEDSKCASACAFILAAGKRRLVGPNAFVGVHQVRSFYIYTRILPTYRLTATRKQLVSRRRVTEHVVETKTPQKTYDQIRRYFLEMGVGEEIMPLILATPGDQLHWMTHAELQATHLATEWIDGAQLVTKAAAPAEQVVISGTGNVPAGASAKAAATALLPR